MIPTLPHHCSVAVDLSSSHIALSPFHSCRFPGRLMDIFPCLIVCREASLKVGNHDLHDLMCIFGKDLLAKWHHLLDLVRCPVTNEIILWYPMHEDDISYAGVVDLNCQAQATARLLAHALSKQTGTCRISCWCKLICEEHRERLAGRSSMMLDVNPLWSKTWWSFRRQLLLTSNVWSPLQSRHIQRLYHEDFFVVHQ